MMRPKYRPGDRVLVLPDRDNSNVRPGAYTITRVMPASPDGPHYRVKNEMDTHECVLRQEALQPESDFALAATPAVPPAISSD